MPNVVAASLLTAGLRTDFVGNYQNAKRRSDIDLAPLMQLDIPSDKLTEIFAYTLAAPYMRRWPRDSAIPTGIFGSVQFSVTNKDWGQRIKWHRNDRQDDQTGSLYTTAQKGGDSAGTLDARVAIQMLAGSTDTDLLDAIPNCPDGAALASATDGSGANRFGVSNGNLLAGSGVATAIVIRTDFWRAVAQFRAFQDGQGQPLMLDEDLTRFTIYCGSANDLVFREAFFQSPTAIGANTATSNAGVQNNTQMQVSGKTVRIQTTQRITDNDWWVLADDCWVKPLFSLNREGLRFEDANMENGNAESLSTGEEFLQAHLRRGYGANLPFGLVKINN